MAETVHTQTTRAALQQALERIPQEARAGGAAANAMMTRCGLAILGRIKRAFIVKSRGGTDEAGDRWAPLSPKTIAYSKTRSRGRGGRTKAEKNRPDRPSQALNTRQRDRWWALYRQGLAIFKGDKGSAAARAWAILKREGAVTLVQKYGNRQVDILRDTGLLLNSLSPGVDAGPKSTTITHHANSIFRVGPGEVVVGTNRKGAAAHHYGTPRLPRRRLWPDPYDWPKPWWDDILDQARAGLIEITAELIRNQQ